MSKIVFISFLLLLLGGGVYAESFQILDKESEFYMGFSPVYCNEELQGHTDKLGRIIINLPVGQYICEIVYREKRKQITLKIDGSNDQKVIA